MASGAVDYRFKSCRAHQNNEHGNVWFLNDISELPLVRSADLEHVARGMNGAPRTSFQRDFAKCEAPVPCPGSFVCIMRTVIVS